PNCELIIPNKLTFYNTDWMIFTDEEIYDIIVRDRFLSKIQFNKAVQLIKNVTHQIMGIITKLKLKLMTGPVVDYYTVDIFYRLAIKMSIKCFYMVVGIKGTMKFYDYRWPIKRIKPNTCINLFEYMEKKEKNIYSTHKKDTTLYRMRRVFYIKRRQLQMYNFLNPDVRNGNTDVEILKRGLQALPKSSFKDFYINYFQELNKIKFDNKKRIYISLHFFPEATMNYFSENNTLINHDDLVLEILNRFNNIYNFIIKEHPVMSGKRSLSFYEKIRKIPNCYLVKTETDTYDVVAACDVVLSWAGSIGWEAPFLGKKTINIMKPYYHVEGISNYFFDYKDLMTNFAERIEGLDYDNDQYCKDLNERFQSFSFEGIPVPTYNTSNNIELMAKSTDQLVYDIFQL
ncbi:hypothetical protein ACFLSV_08585, partial [Bacteroidota bacterium]